jgi:DNA (cytosine-5)-methyltransferase 1
VIRHRYFEIGGWAAIPTEHKPHRGTIKGWNHGRLNPDGVYYQVYGAGGRKGTVAEWQEAMGIDWTDNRKSIAEAIPPAYTRFIGGQLMALVETQRELKERAA